MEKLLRLESAAIAQALFGTQDENLKTLENELGVKIILRSDNLKVSGNNKNVRIALQFIEHILNDIRSGRVIDKEELLYLIHPARNINPKKTGKVSGGLCSINESG